MLLDGSGLSMHRGHPHRGWGRAFRFVLRGLPAILVIAALAGWVAQTGGGAPPSARASGSMQVLWRADAERPLSRQWAEYSTAAHCAVLTGTVRRDRRVFRERFRAAQGSYAYEFRLRNGDRCFGERAEVGQALPSRSGFTRPRLFREGDDRWIAFQVYLSRHFHVRSRNWDVIAQWKQGLSTAVVPVPMVALQVHDGGFYLERADGTTSTEARTIGTRLARAYRRRWVRMVVHINFSTDPAAGFVEVYGDPNGTGMRLLMPLEHFSTLATDAAGAPVPAHARIGIYRSPAIRGKARLFYDGYTVATSRTAAQRVAFAP
jgi:hypothetical protein